MDRSTSVATSSSSGGGFFTPAAPISPRTRIAHGVGAVLCVLSIASLFGRLGVLAFGMQALTFALVSGGLHASRVAGYAAPAVVRVATVGVGLGACLSLHAFVRAAHRDAYIEHIGGPPVLANGADAFMVLAAYVLAPLASTLHAIGTPFLNPAWPMATASVQVTFVASVHELVVAADTVRVLQDADVLVVLLWTIVSVSAWVLVIDVVLRLMATKRDDGQPAGFALSSVA